MKTAALISRDDVVLWKSGGCGAVGKKAYSILDPDQKETCKAHLERARSFGVAEARVVCPRGNHCRCQATSAGNGLVSVRCSLAVVNAAQPPLAASFSVKTPEGRRHSRLSLRAAYAMADRYKRSTGEEAAILPEPRRLSGVAS